MEALSTAEPTLQWFWIIEYLTTLQQVAVRVLNDLLDESPPFPAELKSKIDELIALRTLEELWEAGDKSADGTGIDLSETCLNVLNCILKEASISDIMTRNKPLHFDIRPFILHKRAAMPKSALQQIFSESQFVNNQGPIKETMSWAFIRQMLKKPMHMKMVHEGGSTSREYFPIDTENFPHQHPQGRGEVDFLLPNAKKLKQTVLNTSKTKTSVCNPFETGKSVVIPDGVAEFVEGDGLGNEALCTVDNGNLNPDRLESGNKLLEGNLIRSGVLRSKKRMFGCNSEYSENLVENLQECEQSREDPDLLPKVKKLRCSAIEAEEELTAINVNGRIDAGKFGSGTIKESSENCIKLRKNIYTGSKNRNFVQESTTMDVCADGLKGNARNTISADGLEQKEDIVEPKEQNVCLKCKQTITTDGMNLSRDCGNGGSSHEEHPKEALDDLHSVGYRTPEHVHEIQRMDESPVSPTEETQKQKETKVTTPWQKLISFGTSILMAGLGGSDHKKK